MATSARRGQQTAGTGLALWRLRTAGRRSATQWRLLVVVTAVALLVGTLLASLSLLLEATERSGLRTALTQADPATRATTVTVEDLLVGVDEARESVDTAVATVTGPAPLTSTGIATSGLQAVDVPREPGQAPVLTYLGLLEQLEGHAELVDGAWPSTAPGPGADAGTPIPVALPQVMATDLGLELGSVVDLLSYTVFDQVATLEVVGLYTVADPGGDYWGPDPLGGSAVDDSFPVPGTGGQITTRAYGPLVAGPGALTAGTLGVASLVVRYDVDFADAQVADLAPLLGRLDRAEDVIARDIGPIAERVRVTTRLEPTVQDVATALVVTRASVLVVGLLLTVLAVAALLQTARLLSETRAGEQNLMRARGASGRQLGSLAATEAAWLAAVTAVVSPLLARQVYLLLARRPEMSEAGMDVDPGLPGTTWLTAAAAAALFAIVLLAPLLRRTGTFVEGEQARARPDRRSVLTRSGLDLALVALAGVAYWQLQSYRSPLGGTGATLRVDPVLVAGPAVVLLAGSLLCVRLVPAASRLAERVGARGRGVVAPLAAWEVGRRSARATAAVLLLTLALAVGTFSQSFLATWRASQDDQAQFTTGAAVRVEDLPGATLTQRSSLAPTSDPAGDLVGPVLRRDGMLAPASAQGFGPPEGPRVEVLGLSAEAREMLTEGRLADEGGAAVAAIEIDLPTSTGIELPGDVAGIGATVRAGEPGATVPGVAVILRAVVEDAHGLLMTLDLATLPVDGSEHAVRGLLPQAVLDASAEDPEAVAAPLRLVGLQSVLYALSPEATSGAFGDAFSAEIALRDLAVLEVDPAAAEADEDDAPTDPATLTSRPVEVPADLDWYALSRATVPLSADAPEGWQLGARLSGYLTSLRFGAATVAQIGWPATANIPAVLSTTIADDLGVAVGEPLTLVVDDATVRVVVADIVPRVPTADGAEVVVVDQRELARVIAQAGGSRSAVDEWWVTVADDEVEDYLTDLGTDPSGTPAADRATARVLVAQDMTQHPLRVATQGALWLVTLAAALLAAVGFAIHATVSLRARHVEFAQLRAIGLTRRRLTGIVAVESLLLCVLGVAFGIGLGALLGWLVGPLVAVSATGRPPVPEVLVHIPWADVALLAVEVVAVLAAVVLVVARSQRSTDPASVLRLGDER